MGNVMDKVCQERQEECVDLNIHKVCPHKFVWKDSDLCKSGTTFCRVFILRFLVVDVIKAFVASIPYLKRFK